ncbi:MAG: isoleucine--tRNA ligase [Dehalococcoidia bacterium]|nr:isoleucine--tRNA ligase [Dehalococcoidia bacterium]MDD5495062.1 isoleucine--tRNA ligase [Dehalococcoidia bacterium]
MFKPVNSKISFPELEKSILAFWKENRIFEKSIETRENLPKFIFFEGPPTANGNPGIHHVLSRVYKDVIPRYKTMKGYCVPRKAGWDTHGLPVELEVEKMLGFTGKAQIESYGVAKFNNLCRESVFKYLKQWNALTERIGFWLDMDHPYVTLDNSYIESCWWAIKQLWDKGLIYQGYKVTPHCPRCGTSLSSHEVALGYKDDAVDPSIYIKFRINKLPAGLKEKKVEGFSLQKAISGGKVYFLAWTTTPWTLPGNTSLALAADADYALIEHKDEYLLFARALMEQAGLKDSRILAIYKGSELEGSLYEPLYNPHTYDVERKRTKPGTQGQFELQKADKALTYRVITADFVSMEDGTGIVHIAPAFGEVDFLAGLEKNLDFVQQVDLTGKITGTYPFAGKFVKDADPEVLKDLDSRNLLLKSGTITHTYPFCWRCDAPLLYYAKKTWYIRTSARKDEMISGNRQINWYPEHIKEGRFGDWLRNNVDWAFSRERYWGTPLNIWNCPGCGHYECLGSRAEIAEKPGLSGFNETLDLHRPYVDEIKYNCPKCGGRMERQLEVIDCWFDSGAMPFAQWHYPFENVERFKESFPADYISEAVDQTRGWFYSLHALSTLIFDQPCYKNVICLGHILDAQGEKMSKARGNVVDPWVVLDSSGADALRWYMFTASPPGNVRRLSVDMVVEVMRNFIMTLWNTYSFFVIYANIDNFVPGKANVKPSSDLDKWLISSLNQLVADVDELLDNYDPTAAGRKIESFVNDLSNWYVRRSRRRFWKSQNDDDKLSAYNTLYQALVTLSKLLAPFIPFIADEMYQNLVRPVDKNAAESVHLASFPVADTSLIDKDIITETDLAMKVCSMGRSARAKSGMKVRQPLPRVVVKTRSKGESKALDRLCSQILDELNVKAIEFADSELPEGGKLSVVSEGDYQVGIVTELTEELVMEGMAREIVRRLQTMRRSAGLEIADHIVTYYHGDNKFADVFRKFADYIKQETLTSEIIEGAPQAALFTEKFKISGRELALSINKQVP